MRDMDYLTEKDIPYFEEKAKKGEAVIIYLDPDALLESGDDLEKLLESVTGSDPKNGELTSDHIEQFLKRHKVILDEEAFRAKAKITENEDLMRYIEQQKKQLEGQQEKGKESIRKNLERSDLSQEEKELFQQALKDGFTEDELRLLFDWRKDKTLRSQLYEGILNRKY